MGDNRDFAALKKLFTSWNVEILYDLFKEEDISIEELKMIKFSHISALLKNYKMGVKIRLEYNLENWRNKIGKPVRGEDKNSFMCNCPCKSTKENAENLKSRDSNKTKPATTNAAKRIRIDNGPLTDHLELEYSEPKSPQSESSCPEVQITNEMPHLTPIPIMTLAERQQSRLCYEQPPDGGDTDPPTSLTELLTSSLADSPNEDGQPKFLQKNTPDSKSHVTLAQILKLSGTRGMAIVKYYDEHKRLTNTHRTQLIQTIVEFFDDNDYHLSLNMSHNLEWQLLKMFPSEKLDYYRTEKRGKIYVKFSNMKRYKRERNSKSFPDRVRRKSTNQNSAVDEFVITENLTDNNMDNNMDTSYDTWPEGTEAGVAVKPEVLSDDDEEEGEV